MDAIQKSRLLHFVLVLPLLVATLAKAEKPIYISQELKGSVSKYSDFSPSKDMTKRAEKITATVNSKEWQEKQEEMKQRIRSTLSIEDKGDTGPDSITQDRPVLFVSSSMPIKTLRAYAADLAKVDGVMIMRGGVEGLKKISHTLRFTAEVLKLNPGCEGPKCVMRSTPMLIDPVLFKRYKITAVPALVFQKNMNIASYCERPDQLDVSSENHIVYGDSALEGMLREVFRMSKDRSIKPFLAKLTKPR